jgi:hypothetical protein
MAEMKEAKVEKRSYKKMMGMHIRKMANGGHVVSHEHHSDGMMSMPKEHSFGKEDGENGTTYAHVMEHMSKMGIHPEGHGEEGDGAEGAEKEEMEA